MKKVEDKTQREDDYFKRSAKFLAKRANIKVVKCYVDKVPGKAHLRKFIYKQPDAAQVIIVLSRSMLTSGHTMITALLGGAAKLAKTNPDMPKIVIGKLPKPTLKKPSKYKGKKPYNNHIKNKKMSQNDSGKPHNTSKTLPMNKKKLNYKPMKTKRRPKR